MKRTQKTSNSKATKFARLARGFNRLSKANQKAISRLIEAHYSVERRASALRLNLAA